MAADLPQGLPALRCTWELFTETLGNLEKALEEARESVRLEPDSGSNYEALCFAYINLNRLDEAEAVFKQAGERKLESEWCLQPATN